MDFPKLRSIEVIPTVVSGRRAAVLRDPTGVGDGGITVDEDIVYVLQFFDGKHSLLDIRAEYMRRFGSFLFESKLNQLIGILDTHLLLESEHFTREMEKLRAEYARQPVREPSHAGSAYDNDPVKLRATLASYFGDVEKVVGGELKTPAIKGLIVPHIDLRAGGRCIASGYRELLRTELPDLYVILGTGHGGAENLFALTKKDFRTPLGLTRTDKDFVESFSAGSRTDFFADELAHRAEHSIEFQVLFLQYIHSEFRSEKGEPRIVPVLCSFDYDVAVDGSPTTERHSVLREFCTDLAEAISASGKRVCVIASVDFAHLGPRYGDSEGVLDVELSLVKSQDMETIALLEQGDGAGFLQRIAKERNRRRICGFSPIYTLLSVVGPARGRLLCYDLAQMDNVGSIVTFATLVFE